MTRQEVEYLRAVAEKAKHPDIVRLCADYEQLRKAAELVLYVYDQGASAQTRADAVALLRERIER